MVKRFIILVLFDKTDRFLIYSSLIESERRKRMSIGETLQDDALRLNKMQKYFRIKIEY